jgi:hypothetical protein
VKLELNCATLQSCLKFENTSIEILQGIKTSNQQLVLRCVNPMQRHKKYEKLVNMTPPKLNNPTIMANNYCEVDEIP